MGLLPGLPLSKHHLSYTCKVTRNSVSCSSAVIWLIKALWKMWEHSPLQMEAFQICRSSVCICSCYTHRKMIYLCPDCHHPHACVKSTWYKQNQKYVPERANIVNQECFVCLSVSTATYGFTNNHSLNRVFLCVKKKKNSWGVHRWGGDPQQKQSLHLVSVCPKTGHMQQAKEKHIVNGNL